jgi:DNA gyrase subunit A
MTDISSKVPVNIEDEMKRSYMDYAMSVIIGRALPDARDGLKPAHRRVLYGMRAMGLASNRAYRKCAKIVGEVMGNYHPHGDASIYDTLVRLAQEFSMRYPLVDGQGNFGSIDGDPPAAMRYTEARPEAMAEAMMADLDKDTVDFVPNYDETTEEPTVLPTTFPNLLVNGSAGIAVGMATNIPPHNMREVIDGCIAAIEQRGQPRDVRMKSVLRTVSGARFPDRRLHRRADGDLSRLYDRPRFDHRSGREGLDRRNRRRATRRRSLSPRFPTRSTRSGFSRTSPSCTVRRPSRGSPDLRDESDRDGMRIVVELKRGEVPEVVLNNLYKHTPLQTDVRHHHAGDRRRAAEGPEHPRGHRAVHRVPPRSGAAPDRVRAAEGRGQGPYPRRLKIALDHLDEVIKLIRGSKSPAEAREGLQRSSSCRSSSRRRSSTCSCSG